jgi:hypothetical protein
MVDHLTIGGRFWDFWLKSPDDAQNRHRMVFSLIAFFCLGIVYELYSDHDMTARGDLIKTFSTTIVWLVGIYVGGTVVARVTGTTVADVKVPE